MCNVGHTRQIKVEAQNIQFQSNLITDYELLQFWLNVVFIAFHCLCCFFLPCISFVHIRFTIAYNLHIFRSHNPCSEESQSNKALFQSPANVCKCTTVCMWQNWLIGFLYIYTDREETPAHNIFLSIHFSLIRAFNVCKSIFVWYFVRIRPYKLHLA